MSFMIKAYTSPTILNPYSFLDIMVTTNQGKQNFFQQLLDEVDLQKQF